MPFRLVTPPDEEPVTLEEAKQQLRIETADDNDEVNRLISAARQHVEELCWRGLIQQQWELVLPGFDSPRIELPMGQLATLDDDPAVESVKYIDQVGVERTLSTDDYSVDDVSVPGQIYPAPGKCWPAPRAQWDAVRVLYTVGWTVDDVPEALKQAVLLVLSQMYEKRTPEVGQMPAVLALAAPYRLFGI